MPDLKKSNNNFEHMERMRCWCSVAENSLPMDFIWEISRSAAFLRRHLSLSLMDEYYEAVILYRQRNYEKCLQKCNNLLQNVTYQGNISNDDKQWMKDGMWQLKMRALTQKNFVDELEADDNGSDNEEIQFERIATAARPGTSIKTAFTPKSTRNYTSHRPRTMTARITSGMLRPGTTSKRPGSSMSSRPATRCATARRICMTSAAAYNLGDPTASLFQASRMNPTIYAERSSVIKPLFQFLYYHESDPQKAYLLCEAVADVKKGDLDWWWEQQRGRCLVQLNQPKKAEDLLKKSLGMFPHPDTYLLMSKMYLKLEQPQKALQLLESAIESLPNDTTLRTQQARIYEQLDQMPLSIQTYRTIAQLDAMNAEALACIAVHHFYNNQPEMALMYYRRILTMGAHSAELYCNIALCCLYSGQVDLILPCFQRSIRLATTAEQRGDIWYNLSFVALTTGDFNLARRCLRLCLTADASNGAALNNLAVLAAHAGTFVKAKSYLLAAQSVLPDCPEVEKNLKFLEKHY